MSLTAAIKDEAKRLGFDAVGIASVGEDDGTIRTGLGRLRAWLARGYQATMAWMARQPERRADPRLVLPGCRAVICVGLNYYTDQQADETPGHGRIARYAWGRDYHEVLGERLKALATHVQTLAPGAGVRWYVDTGPVMEKVWAQRAGLGWIGKHSNLVSSEFGSWLLLGEILTTLDLEPDAPAADLCGSCTVCLRACPTGAIVEPYVVDAGRCVSYLTIERPRAGEPIPAWAQRPLGNRIFGCDDCLDACPYNVHATPTREPAFTGTPHTLSPDLGALSRLSEAEFAARFAESPVRRARYPGLLEQVRVAIENARHTCAVQ
ncbi:tRNA epoxyqueuosine(34) reductase QueG [Candidatus Nitrospira bockiana]